MWKTLISNAYKQRLIVTWSALQHAHSKHDLHCLRKKCTNFEREKIIRIDLMSFGRNIQKTLE